MSVCLAACPSVCLTKQITKRKAKSIFDDAKKIAEGWTTESVTSLNEDGLHLKMDLIYQTEASFTLTHDFLEDNNNKRLISEGHISAIMNLPKVEGSSSGKLGELSDQINLRLRALHSMGTPVEISECILVCCLLQRSTVKPSYYGRMVHPLKGYPSVVNLLNFWIQDHKIGRWTSHSPKNSFWMDCHRW